MPDNVTKGMGLCRILEENNGIDHGSRALRIAILLSALINLLDTSFMSGLSAPVLKIYQESIAQIADKVDGYFEQLIEITR